MKVLVTGSAGHLGEALVLTGQNTNHEVVCLDIVASNFTSKVGSIVDRSCLKRRMKGVHAVLRTASWHKPHVVTRSLPNLAYTHCATSQPAGLSRLQHYGHAQSP